MLQEGFSTAEQDMKARALTEARVEAERMKLATASALEADAALLSPEERSQIDALLAELARAAEGSDAAAIEAALKNVAKGTEPFAARRMNEGIRRALAGKNEVRVFAYVDRQVPMLARMFARCEAGYGSMGYRLGEPSSVPGVHRQLVIEYDDLSDTDSAQGDTGNDEVQ